MEDWQEKCVVFGMYFQDLNWCLIFTCFKFRFGLMVEGSCSAALTNGSHRYTQLKTELEEFEESSRTLEAEQETEIERVRQAARQAHRHSRS